ncbi:heavy metal transporter [filamentous cyanobacterium CCP1]|nr:heavy metal transporter [filamentous cyanobacterium CCP2]PSB68500.1 heavy metal transporter [filamentous cyanobacterium CCP1]
MTLEFTVPNMACADCASTITKAVKTVDPGAEVKADPKTKQVSIATQADESAVKEAIVSAGYSVA